MTKWKASKTTRYDLKERIGKGKSGKITEGRFNKIAIQGTHQTAVDKETISLSRVY